LVALLAIHDLFREGKDGYFIAANFGWFDPRYETFRKQFLKETKRKGIKFYHLFSHEVKEKAGERIKEVPNNTYKFLPKKYCTNSAIDIFGDYVVTYNGITFSNIDENVTIFVLRDQCLAESYRTWFRMIWVLLPESK